MSDNQGVIPCNELKARPEHRPKAGVVEQGRFLLAREEETEGQVTRAKRNVDPRDLRIVR